MHKAWKTLHTLVSSMCEWNAPVVCK